MMVEELCVSMYTLVPMITLGGYVPQIMSLLKAETAPKSFPMPMWLIWLAASIISLLYGVTYLGDFMFSLTAGLNLGAQVVVIGTVLYKTYKNQLLSLFYSPVAIQN